MSLLSLLFEGFLEGFQKTISRLEKAPPSAEATEPSSEAAEPSADAAKPSSKTAKPRPIHGDSTFSSKSRPSPASPIYGDSAALSKPGLHAPEPSLQSPEPDPQTAKPNRASRARGGSQERSWCCTGLRGFEAKTSRGNSGPRGGQSQNSEAQAIWPILVKKVVSKSDFLVQASRKWAQTLGDSIKTAKPNTIFINSGTSAKVP